MANSALIDDLLKQFAGNPRRVFARLANEYRKRGELDSAIEICRSHVPLQPGYISGHIVLGQALYDSGSLEEARSSFETALALDPENLIALRHMGDIARATGSVESARGWYRQLLEIDPQNEEVAAQLESLGASDAAPAASSDADSEALGGWGEVSPEAIDLATESDALSEHEHESEAAPESAAPVAAAPTATAASEDTLALDEIFDVPQRAYQDEPGDEQSEEAPPVAAVDGLEATSFQGDVRLESSPLELVELEDLEELSSDAGSAGEAIETGEQSTEPVAVQGAVAPLFPADSYDFTDEGSPEEDAASSAFATETMAELYLQQGFPDRALAIYRELAARSPDDASLRERIAELTEADDAAPAAPAVESRARSAREFFGVLAYRKPPHVVDRDATPESAAAPMMEAGAEDPDSPAAESGTELVTAESEAGPAVLDSAGLPSMHEARNGTPGREADSALSLDDVFRDAPSSDASGSRKGLSFDEFFARRGNDAAKQPSGAVAAEAHEGVPDAEHSTDEEPQDLELFHAWLDGLKG
jgi:tetratricopeptide (TPR) repeat protein